MSHKKDKKNQEYEWSNPQELHPEAKPFSYDEALQEIQQIVEAMQQPSISMDELLKKNERANVLIELCQKKLQAIKPKFDIPF
ncbi:MAG: Exonuclease small subunit [Bacteroidota bacterium]|jgi:exodeoxyribonuclease VII small subunit